MTNQPPPSDWEMPVWALLTALVGAGFLLGLAAG
jgi:hypothetical protein